MLTPAETRVRITVFRLFAESARSPPLASSASGFVGAKRVKEASAKFESRLGRVEFALCCTVAFLSPFLGKQTSQRVMSKGVVCEISRFNTVITLAVPTGAVL